MNYSVQQAIEESIRENTIAILEARADTSEWVNLANSLGSEAQDWAETQYMGSRDDVTEVREYWGADDDGDEWRVHLYATA